MGHRMWIYAAIIVLVSEAWSQESASLSGTNQSTSVNVSSPAITAVRNLTFNLGSDANLTCSNKTWTDVIYVIWKIKVKDKPECMIGFNSDGRSEDTCNNGKLLRNTTNFHSYLYIPKFSTNDEGVYKCELVYNGGNEEVGINVAITVAPTISAWLEHKDNRMVAVCKAEKGKPAARISWRHDSNSSDDKIQELDGFFTVYSRLLLENVSEPENLTCVIRHPYWDKEKSLVLNLNTSQKDNNKLSLWLTIPVVVIIIALLVGFSFLAQKKLLVLRRCKQSGPSSSKSPQTEDVEEVEPYASYMQRENSIYN